MEKTYRDMACEDLQKTLHKLANDHRAIALALGPEYADYEVEMIRLAERMWWCVQDYKVGALDKAKDNR